MSVIKKLAEGLDPKGPDLIVYLNLSLRSGLCYLMDVYEPEDPEIWEKVLGCVERWTELWSEKRFGEAVWYIVFV